MKKIKSQRGSDLDLDVVFYDGKWCGENEGLLYIRTEMFEDGETDMFNVMRFDVGVMATAFLNIPDLKDVIMFAAATYVKDGEDLQSYIDELP